MKRIKKKSKMTNKHGKRNCIHEKVISIGDEFVCKKCGKEL